MSVLRLLVRGYDGFLALPRAAAALLILFGIAVNFANVIGRYLFSAPIPWAEEVMVFGMIWSIFLGAALAERDNEHLSIDLLPMMLSPKLRAVHGVIVAAIVVVVCGFVGWQSLQVTRLFADLGDSSTVAGIPKWLMHGAITVGLFLIVLSAVAGLRTRMIGRAMDAGEPAGGPDPAGRV